MDKNRNIDATFSGHIEVSNYYIQNFFNNNNSNNDNNDKCFKIQTNKRLNKKHKQVQKVQKLHCNITFQFRHNSNGLSF